MTRITEKEKKRLADYRTIFKGPQGERVLADLCHRHGIFDPCHVPGDAYSTAYNDGRRSVVVDLLRYLGTDLERLDNLLIQPYGDYDPRGTSDERVAAI
tara:strand:- start:56 stop:352 length:297 start_codon:yes stop_codon:yes gene_type:complete